MRTHCGIVAAAALLVAASAASAACSRQPAAAPGPGEDSHIKFTATSAELEQRDRPARRDDLRILLRAEGLLSDAAGWNRDDDRVYVDDERSGRRSLFCALHRASLDVLGEYEHRRAALQEVRFAIEDAPGGRAFEHRLRDFNNLAGASHDDIGHVLRTASERIRSRLVQAAR